MRFEARLDDQPQHPRPRPRNPPLFTLLPFPRLHPLHFLGHRPFFWVVTIGVDGVLSPHILESVFSHFGKAER